MIQNRLLVLVGPTASGKSKLALEVAQKCGAGLVNADSVQVYQNLDVGSAKPSAFERTLVPHFLYDYVPPGKTLTAADYRRDAMSVIEAELPRRPLILVGGSGSYLQAVLKGMYSVPSSTPEIAAQLSQEWDQDGGESLWQELVRHDVETSRRIHRNDRYRICRALTVWRHTGTPLSKIQKHFAPQQLPFEVVKMGLNLSREQLQERIFKRAQEMLASGLLAETQNLIQAGHENWPPLTSVGYRECQMALRGQVPEAKLTEAITTATRQLAKRQMTWFRRDADIRWFDAVTEWPQAVDFALRSLE